MSSTPAYKEYEEIFRDWDLEKNKIQISEIKKNSKEAIWWKCKNNHSYPVSVFSRIRSNGCKICNKPIKSANSRKARLKKGKSFGELHPHLLKEWDFDKNLISPTEITEKSNAKVWFKCEDGHSWLSSPKRRLKGNNCPSCYEQNRGQIVRQSKLFKKGKSLADEFPALMQEWDYELNSLPPQKYSSGSNEKVAWKCKFQHTWEANIYNRTQNDSGCPYCTTQTSKLEIFLLCELKKLFHNVEWRAKIDGFECDILLKDEKIGIEVDGGYWHSTKIERDKLKNVIFKKKGINLIRLRDNSLPDINGSVVKYDKNSKYIDLVIKVLIQCKRINQKLNFHTYIKNEVQVGFNEYKKTLSLLPAPTEKESLSIKSPALSLQWDFKRNNPLTPAMFSPNSEKKVFWKCAKNHSWEASIKNRYLRGSGCPKCYKQNAGEIVRKAILKKRGVSLSDKYPELLKEWDYNLNSIVPEDVSPGSAIKAYWKCENGHSWQAGIGSRTSKGYGCPICMDKNRSFRATRIRIQKTGTLAEKHPDLLKEWDYKNNEIDPENYPSGSKKKVNWICDKGHKWEAVIKSRVGGNGHCPTCQSIVITNPKLLSEWDFEKNLNIKPNKIRAGSNIKIWWLCEYKHSYQQSTYEKLKGHNGCSTCRKKR